MHAPEVPDPIRGLITSRASLILVLLFVVVFGPVFEELVFRGFLFPLLATQACRFATRRDTRVWTKRASGHAVEMNLEQIS